MRIAQVAPLTEAVPPKLYGGTERVVSWITEELVALGHDVTLFASGDSLTSARLISPCSTALRLSSKCVDPLPHHIISLDQVIRLVPNPCLPKVSLRPLARRNLCVSPILFSPPRHESFAPSLELRQRRVCSITLRPISNLFLLFAAWA